MSSENYTNNARVNNATINNKTMTSFLIDNSLFRKETGSDVRNCFSNCRSKSGYSLVTIANNNIDKYLNAHEIYRSTYILAKFPGLESNNDAILIFDTTLFEAMHGPHKSFFKCRTYSDKASDFFIVYVNSIEKEIDLPLPLDKIISHPAVYLTME